MILGKILQWPKVLKRRRKLLRGGWVKDANAVDRTHNGNVLRCKFNEPKEGKLGDFSCLESLKKNIKENSNGVPFSSIV
jgi:hypothetical protein